MKPEPLLVGEANDTHECVVRKLVDVLPEPPDDRPVFYRKGKHWGQWVVNDVPVWVTLVSVGPADWRFAAFRDGPEFRV